MRSHLRVDGILLLSGLLCFGCSSGSNKGQGTTGTGTGGDQGIPGSQSTGTGGPAASGGSPGSTGTAGTKPGGSTAGTNASSGGNGSAAGQGATAGASGKGSAGGGGGSTGTPSGAASVLQYHNNASRDGLYVDAAFTKTAAAKLHRDKSFNAKVTGAVYAQPLYFAGGPGGKDLVIVATEANEVTALNAADGSVVWQRKSDVLGMPAGSSMSHGGCGNINPLGITGTPVIDAASRMLYFDAMDATGTHKIFALSVDDGMAPAGWPVDVSKVTAGSQSFNSPSENQRGALAILNGTLLVPYGGHYGDCGEYRGWVVAVPLNDPKSATGWATRAIAGGIWAPSGVATDGTSLYFATGNTEAAAGIGFGTFSPPSSWGDGEAIFKMPPTLKASGQPADYWAAPDWSALDQGDADVGGTGPVLFSVPGATPSELAIAFGKNGSAYMVDRANLGGMAAPLGQQDLGGNAFINAAAAYTTDKGTYVTSKTYAGQALVTVQITPTAPPKIMMAWSQNVAAVASPMVTTTDGKSDAIVWIVGAAGDGKIHGFDGDTGMPIFTGGGADEQLPAVDKFQTPIVANGRMFVAAEGAVYAFSLN